jgi:hypothetical protein
LVPAKNKVGMVLVLVLVDGFYENRNQAISNISISDPFLLLFAVGEGALVVCVCLFLSATFTMDDAT